VRAVDVADPIALKAVLDALTRGGLPIRGLFHLAGVLDDTPVAGLTPERILAPFRPKAVGGINLMGLTATRALDYTVLFSSVASVFGTPGQANYAAANAVLDALGGDPGRHCLSINLGPFSGVGLAAEDAGRLRSLDALGLSALDPSELGAALDRLLGAGLRGQVVLARFQPATWAARYGAADLAFVASLAVPSLAEADTAVVCWLDQVTAIPAGRARRKELQRLLIGEAAATLRLPTSRISVDQPMRAVGMDSLLTLEFRNRLERASGLRIGAPVFFSHPTIAALAGYLAERWGVVLEAPPQIARESAPDPEDLDRLLGDLEQMTEDEARSLLEGEGTP
jgi:hypothetical protein